MKGTTANGMAVCQRLLLATMIASTLGGWHADAFAAAAAAGPGGATAGPATTDADFDQNLLPAAGRNHSSDLSRFEHGAVIEPGTYRTDVFLNGAWVGHSDVRFAAPTPEASAIACFNHKLIDQLGLPWKKFTPEQQAKLDDANACVDIASIIPAASITFDQENLRVDVSIPQAWLGGHARGYVSPENWDRGINAALLNYSINSYRTRNNGISQTSTFGSLNAGLNLAGWQLRSDSNVLYQSGSAGTAATHHFQNVQTYARRDLPDWRAQLTVGDSYTGGDLFDSVSIRGVQLATDDRMLPDSLRGYAPTVRGVAETNAKVTIRQNGILLYETPVAPGPFVIDDLYATGYGGDLNVTITEADGRLRAFSVPYASVPQLLRPGVSRFALVVGELHDSSLHEHPAIAQATLQRGFTNTLSGYAGVVGTDGYGAIQVGTALDTRLGAVAFDITGAHTEIPGQASRNGQSARLSYSKILPDSDTSLTVATYRYSTSGYLGLRDALLMRDIARGHAYLDPGTINTIDGVVVPNLLTPNQQASLQGTPTDSFAAYTNQLDRQRSRFDINLNQRLGAHGGSLYVTGSAVDYWNRNGTDLQFQLGYNNNFHRLSYTLSATRVRDALSRYSNQFFASFTLPLGDSAHAPQLGLNINRDSSGHMLSQGTLNGTAGSDNQFSYGGTASHDNGEGGSSSGGNAENVYAGYRSSFAQFNGSYGKGQGYSQASVSVAGTIVAHSGGILFGEPAGDTLAIVAAPDAKGAQVLNAAGVRINGSGYALVPYLSPYQLNKIQLDPKGLPLTVQLDSTSAQVAPHAGAVVLVKFKTESGRSMIVHVRTTNGQTLPFGAEVVDEQGHSLGVIGQAGRALLRGTKEQGQLTVQWSNQDNEAMTCSFPYHTPKNHPTKHQYQAVEATCQAVADRRSQP